MKETKADTVTMTKANYLEFLNRVYEAGKVLFRKRQAEIDAFVADEAAVMTEIVETVKSRLWSDGIDIVRMARYEAKYGPRNPWWLFGFFTLEVNSNKWSNIDYKMTKEEAIEAALKAKGQTLEEAVSSFITTHQAKGYALATVLSSFYSSAYGKMVNGVANRLSSLPSVPKLIESVGKCNDADFTLAMDTYNKYTQLLIDAETK
jgi:hypothetical protein